MSLGKQMKVHNLIGSPRCTQTLNICTKETSFCFCLRASLTVEAAVVMPLTIGFLACVLFLFRILQVQTEVEEALIYAGRETAVESSIVSSEEMLSVSAETYFFMALSDNKYVEKYVKNGIFGISLNESRFDGDTIELKALYSINLPVDYFDLYEIEICCQNSFRKWIGDVPAGTKIGEWVYITPTGTVYHLSASCQSLDISVNEVGVNELESYRGANGQRYYSCTFCGDKNMGTQIVYCTEYGHVFHREISCKALKRTIVKIPISEVEGRPLCSFC